MSTPVDVQSLMAYSLPAEIMKDGIAVPGGSEPTESDIRFMQDKYPLGVAPPPDDDENEDIDSIDPLPDGPEWDIPYDLENDWS